MKNIQFTPPSDEKIKNGTKTMTARFWHENYINRPFKGEIVTASTGRRKETRFAELLIIQIKTWRPGDTDEHMIFARTGYTFQQIAEKEGFENFNQFFDTYSALNNHHDPHDPWRNHYFIEFEVIRLLP